MGDRLKLEQTRKRLVEKTSRLNRQKEDFEAETAEKTAEVKSLRAQLDDSAQEMLREKIALTGEREELQAQMARLARLRERLAGFNPEKVRAVAHHTKATIR